MQKGFTLIEMLLSVALVALLAGLSVPVYAAFQSKNDLAVAVDAWVEAAHRAQTYAQTGYHDASWGVHVSGNMLILYKGTSFAARDSAYDEATSLGGVTASGLVDVIFIAFTGKPQSTGVITLAGVQGDAHTITVYDQGTITY